ncbi:hypothetical protein [Microtetraspora sp. NBRC 16547]|uniref:hypothetical protein n=1 Tax=Microtetraspora sp. NBRC 16547 TaxID=3030993 RepID=UPI0024A53B93|nr:hypothetical protein [Microtetraspora sp. NBRC 16547]GLW99858.1 hypothetical protein Misp02_39450 [Microtetraspora sp. NBRC 16547]
MRIRLASAAVLAAAASITPAAPASAGTNAHVPPGTYEIVDGEGLCLRGEGYFNSKVLSGPCDTRWRVTLLDGGENVMIQHAVSGNCVSVALERIYPPMVATLPCDPAPERNWALRDVGDGQVAITRGFDSVTHSAPGRPALLLGNSPDLSNQQRWTFRPTG